MAKLLRREIDAIISEILKANNQKNQEYIDSIDYESFKEDLQPLEVVKEMVKQRDELFEQVEEIENTIDAYVKANNLRKLITVIGEYTNPKTKKGNIGKPSNNVKYNLLLKKGLINPPKYINSRDLENYIVINNNGDLAELLEKTKQHFNI